METIKVIPALLPITKPKIHSIDKKGRAMIQIQLLSFPHTKSAIVRSSTYNKYTTDQLIFVSIQDPSLSLYSIVRFIGDATKTELWNTILPYRLKLPIPAVHQPITLYSPLTDSSLKESKHYVRTTTTLRKFLLVDSPGTVDREDGVWFDNVSSYGTFVIDVPSQLGWINNTNNPLHYLRETWKRYNKRTDKTHAMLTQTYYLPSYRLPLFKLDTYKCINKKTLETHISLPILCYDIPNKKLYPSQITMYHDVTYKYTTDNTPLPEWYTKSPLASYSFSEKNSIMNSMWHTSIPSTKYLITKQHPTYKQYCPISSPIRSLIDIWNQCVFWEYTQVKDEKNLFNSISMRDKLIQLISRNQIKARLLKHRSSNMTISNIMIEKETSQWEGIVDYIFDNRAKGGFISFLPVLKENIWISETYLYDFEVGDKVIVQFALTRNHDPMNKLRIHSVKRIG